LLHHYHDILAKPFEERNHTPVAYQRTSSDNSAGTLNIVFVASIDARGLVIIHVCILWFGWSVTRKTATPARW
jgi:hypothetical protein